MPLLAKSKAKTFRKPGKQHTTESLSKPRSYCTSTISNKDGPTESRNTVTKNSKKDNKFFVAQLRSLGCKEASASSLPVLAKHTRSKNRQRRKMSSSHQRNPANVSDVSYVCCTPPGVGIASDFVPASGNATRSIDHRKHSYEGMRKRNDSGRRIPGSVIGSSLDKLALRRIMERMMLQEILLSAGRNRHGSDLYEDWRLDIDHMSYEELLDLKQEEISNCLRKFKPSSSTEKDWRCSICQENCGDTDDIGTLECGHPHHLECIKQWLLQKKSCPVCKTAAT